MGDEVSDKQRISYEKLQWLKLYDRNEMYPIIVDKYSAKEYVASIIGSEYIIKTLGVWDTFDEISFHSLPNQFVLKCTHDSGGIIICKDKKYLDYDLARQKLENSLNHNYYYEGREWPYKMVKPRIIAEQYMANIDGSLLLDYKFFCFDGHVKFLYVSEASHTCDQKLQFYDREFNALECKRKDYNDFDILPCKPKTYDKMLEIAEKLSEDIPHVRVDLYEINGQIYFGEMTLYTCSGFIPFADERWDRIFGDYIILPNLR